MVYKSAHSSIKRDTGRHDRRRTDTDSRERESSRLERQPYTRWALADGMETEFRLLVAGFCIVAPSLLFVGFIRLLDAMREDALVERILDRVDEGNGPTGTALDPTTFLRSAREQSRRRTTVCRECGAPNATDGGRCGLCGAALR